MKFSLFGTKLALNYFRGFFFGGFFLFYFFLSFLSIQLWFLSCTLVIAIVIYLSTEASSLKPLHRTFPVNMWWKGLSQHTAGCKFSLKHAWRFYRKGQNLLFRASLHFMCNPSKLTLLENGLKLIPVSLIITAGPEPAIIPFSHGLMIISQISMLIYNVCILSGVIRIFTVQPV